MKKKPKKEYTQQDAFLSIVIILLINVSLLILWRFLIYVGWLHELSYKPEPYGMYLDVVAKGFMFVFFFICLNAFLFYKIKKSTQSSLIITNAIIFKIIALVMLSIIFLVLVVIRIFMFLRH